jgi:protein-S-isoprenylcysteine O-methyltransferase Ste14
MLKPFLAILFAASMWVLLLPGLLIQNRVGTLVPPWRPFFLIVLGAAVLALGCWLVWEGSVRLEAAGVSPFAVHAGPALVTDGIYARVRNPMDLGSTLMAVGPAIAVDVMAVWLVPVSAFLYFAIGRGPLENIHLAEEFGDEFLAYKASVPSWTPLWS